MSSDLLLRRKLTLRAHGEQVVFVKKRRESLEHVLMKAFLWALYLPDYAPLTVECSIGDTHFALAKWGLDLAPFVALVEKALDGLNRTAPFDLLSFPPDSADRFIDARGHIMITHDDVRWVRLGWTPSRSAKNDGP